MLILQSLFFSTVIVVSELEGRISCSVVELGVGDLSSALFLHHWWNFLISFVNCIPYHAICNAITIFFINPCVRRLVTLVVRGERRDLFMTQRPVPHCEQRSCISLQGNPCFPFQPPEDMSLRNVVHA